MGAAELIHWKKKTKSEQANKPKTTTDFNPSLNQGFSTCLNLAF